MSPPRDVPIIDLTGDAAPPLCDGQTRSPRQPEPNVAYDGPAEGPPTDARQKWKDLKGLFDSFFTPNLLRLIVDRSNEYARQAGHRVGRKFKICKKDPTRPVQEGGCGHGQHHTRHSKRWKRMFARGRDCRTKEHAAN